MADRLTLERFRALDLRVDTKPDNSPVSDADRAVEEMLRKRLAAARPADAVVGEEFGRSGSAARSWILDPIDATKNYVRGVPVYATLVALQEAGEGVVGVVSAPALKSRWWAARGDGAFLDGHGIQVSRVPSLREAQVCFASLDSWPEAGLRTLLDLVGGSWRSRGFGDFWQHMLVAQGSAEIALEPAVSLWDMAAVKVIVEEAGGTFSDLQGRRTADGGNAVSSNGLVHGQVLEAFARG